MVVVTLLLFFLPGVNGLIGGAIGGYKAGSAGRGLAAAVLPAVVVAVVLGILLAAFGLPIIGFLAGLATAVVVLLADVGLFIGAAIGGALSNRGRAQESPA
jgi:hypothetical protein